MKKLLVYFSLPIFIIILFVGCSENSENSMTGIYLKSINGSRVINILVRSKGYNKQFFISYFLFLIFYFKE